MGWQPQENGCHFLVQLLIVSHLVQTFHAHDQFDKFVRIWTTYAFLQLFQLIQNGCSSLRFRCRESLLRSMPAWATAEARAVDGLISSETAAPTG